MSVAEVLSSVRSWHVECSDVIPALQRMPDGCVQTCVTSPPYFALRSYLPKDHPDKDKELGLEQSPDCFGWATKNRCGRCYVCKMTAVFGEVRRVLRDDGTFWLNIAGSYNGSGSVGGVGKQHTNSGAVARTDSRAGFLNWKQKDYINVPALLAESLRVDGWYLRSEMTLFKIAPMPESTRDRPTRATEKLYLFSKSPKYFYDREAELVPSSPVTLQRDRYSRITETADHEQYAVSYDHETPSNPGGRNLWDWWDDEWVEDTPDPLWEWRPEGSDIRHYAMFPRWLPARCLSLGTSQKGCCPGCGAPWRRLIEVEKTGRAITGSQLQDGLHERSSALSLAQKRQAYRAIGLENPPPQKTVGWQQSCQCLPCQPVPCVTMDCFSGAGTTGFVARQQGHRFIGIELKPEYAEVSRKRIGGVNPLLDSASTPTETQVPPVEQLSLFD